MTENIDVPPTRIVVLSSLYPNSVQPRHGVFVEERLRCLMATGRVQVRVIAPVPWFFSRHPRFGRYARFAAVPARELRHGIEVLHPRYPVLPRLGMTLAPRSMATCAAPTLARLLADGFDFDLIDAHYFYPDGVAAARLGRRFCRPVVITARGTDINTIADMPRPRRQIRAAAAQASALVTVSQSLREKLVRLGVAPDKITTLRNGVDLARFAPMARETARQRLAVANTVWLSVGNLVQGKGTHIAVEALRDVSDVTLLIVGDGPEEESLRALAQRCNVAQRVRFIGHVAHDELPLYYSAADALLLPSRSEGMPNVVLEAMACGAAVIASAVGGIPEIVRGLPTGVLMSERTPAALVAAWHAVRADGLGSGHREARRRHAQRFSWQATTEGQLELFERVLRSAATDDDAARTIADIGHATSSRGTPE